MPPFSRRLQAAILKTGNPTVVGLDPRFAQLPDALKPKEPTNRAVAESFQRFCCEIIDVVSAKVPAVKPQMAFFEALGPPGMESLHAVVQHARRAGLLVILDGKRNDIGSTATAYAQAYLGAASPWGADALTVSPYLGDDSLDPFVQVAKTESAGIFVLVKTSNPGGKTFQDLLVDGRPLYRHVGELIDGLAQQTADANGYGDVGAVVGATYPEQLSELRALMPKTWFLVPGFGAQGGGVEDVAGAFDGQGLGAVINSSRAIIFAHQRPEFASHGDWQRAVELATDQMIAQLRGLPAVAQLGQGKS